MRINVDQIHLTTDFFKKLSLFPNRNNLSSVSAKRPPWNRVFNTLSIRYPILTDKTIEMRAYND